LLGSSGGVGGWSLRRKLLPRPRLEECAVDREVLVGQQAPTPRLLHDVLEERTGDVAGEQALAILREGGWCPHRVVHRQAHEPAKQQVVLQLLDQHPLATNRVEHLQQQRAQQMLRRHRRPTGLRVEQREPRRQARQRGIRHLPNRPQRMIRRHPLLRRQIAKQVSALLVVSAHQTSDGRQCSTTIGRLGTPFSAAC
jgi:hypothetical protein